MRPTPTQFFWLNLNLDPKFWDRFGLVGPQGPGQECHRGKTAKRNMLTKLEMFGSLGEKEWKTKITDLFWISAKFKTEPNVGQSKVHALKVVNLILFDSNSFPNFYQFKINSETYTISWNISKEFKWVQLKGKTLLEDLNKSLHWKLRIRRNHALSSLKELQRMSIHFWINLELIKVWKNIRNKDDKINDL